jgi:uncharacterized protein YjbI with pentapeptide repeats
VTGGRRKPPVDWAAMADLTLPGLQPAGRDELRVAGRYDGLAFDDLASGDVAADDASFLECRLRGCVIEDGAWRRARLRSCLLEDVRVTALDASDSTWADVVVRGSRIGALVAHGASFVRVTIEHGHLDYVNLRGASMSQCQFLDCRIGELDLGGAEARDVRFVRCEIDSLAVRGAAFDAVDLRGARLVGLDGVAGLAGAVVTEAQLVALAPALAAHLGISVLPPP